MAERLFRSRDSGVKSSLQAFNPEETGELLSTPRPLEEQMLTLILKQFPDTGAGQQAILTRQATGIHGPVLQ